MPLVKGFKRPEGGESLMHNTTSLSRMLHTNSLSVPQLTQTWCILEIKDVLQNNTG